jgi:hypothetical protein
MTKPKTKFAQVYQFIKVTSRAERERHVAQMLANFRLEGFEPDPTDKRLQAAYIEGTVTLNDMLAHARAVVAKLD